MSLVLGATALLALAAVVVWVGGYVLGTIAFAFGAVLVPFVIACFVVGAKFRGPFLLFSFLLAWFLSCVVAFWAGGSEAGFAYIVTIPMALVVSLASVLLFKYVFRAEGTVKSPADTSPD